MQLQILIKSKSRRHNQGVQQPANNQLETHTDGHLRRNPLADHRRAREDQARQPRRSNRDPRGQGLPAKEALGEAEGEEDLPLRQQGGGGLCGSQGNCGSGRIQGHC